MSLEFLLTSLVIVVTPGTGVFYTLAAGLSSGGQGDRRRRADQHTQPEAVRNHVIARPQVLAWMRRGFGAAFAVLGVKLALTQQ
jgi:threonine/homoserine/homoserine lactone efflux protein